MLKSLFSYVDQEDLNNLVATIAAKIEDDQEITDALEVCSLNPNSRVAMLASTSAVAVILAYEAGQMDILDKMEAGDPWKGDD